MAITRPKSRARKFKLTHYRRFLNMDIGILGRIAHRTDVTLPETMYSAQGVQFGFMR
jgi:hypothetical protein